MDTVTVAVDYSALLCRLLAHQGTFSAKELYRATSWGVRFLEEASLGAAAAVSGIQADPAAPSVVAWRLALRALSSAPTLRLGDARQPLSDILVSLGDDLLLLQARYTLLPQEHGRLLEFFAGLRCVVAAERAELAARPMCLSCGQAISGEAKRIQTGVVCAPCAQNYYFLCRECGLYCPTEDGADGVCFLCSGTE